MRGDRSIPSNSAGKANNPPSSSTTGRIALRDPEVHPPKRALAFSASISLRACDANVLGSDRPSASIALTNRPPIPPRALISAMANSSASRNGLS